MAVDTLTAKERETMKYAVLRTYLQATKLQAIMEKLQEKYPFLATFVTYTSLVSEAKDIHDGLRAWIDYVETATDEPWKASE